MAEKLEHVQTITHEKETQKKPSSNDGISPAHTHHIHLIRNEREIEATITKNTAERKHCSHGNKSDEEILFYVNK